MRSTLLTPPSRLRSGVLCGLFASLVFAAPASAAPHLDWTPCKPGFECATARVPLDYDHPSGREIELALTRARAADPARRIGSMFVHNGGPGASNVDFIQAAPPQAIAAITRRYDVIGIDTRGSGHSRPLVDCKVDQQRIGLYSQPFGPAAAARAPAYVRHCTERNRDLIDHMSSADVARDLDRLRAAVGDDRLNLIGHSYGTFVGATYASMFPAHTGRMVLDSPMDAETWVHRPFTAVREQSAALEHELDRFFAATGFSEAAFDELVARLNRTPLGDLDGNDVVIAAMFVTSPREWPDFKDALEDAQQGDGRPLRAMTDQFYSGRLIGFDLAFVEQAVDQQYPHRVGPFLRAGFHAAALFDHFGLQNGFAELPFGLLPASDADAYHGPFRNSHAAPPALVIGTTHDPYTPYTWAQRLTADLRNARLLTYNGDGHGAVTDLNPCIVGTMLAYLEAGVLPPTGASCDQAL
jgi:pimeloyl-ACP methyl ester carboxylesterase